VWVQLAGKNPAPKLFSVRKRTRENAIRFYINLLVPDITPCQATTTQGDEMETEEVFCEGCFQVIEPSDLILIGEDTLVCSHCAEFLYVCESCGTVPCPGETFTVQPGIGVDDPGLFYCPECSQ